MSPSMAATVVESLSTAYPRHGLLTAHPRPRSAAPPVTLLSQGLRALPRLQISVSDGSASRSRPVHRRVVVCEAQKQETAAISVPDVTKTTWQKTVLESDVPVLVEFWASWCGPCRMIEPVIGKLSKVYEGKLKCYKLNTDENADIATQYGIRSIPTMMVFKNGEKVDTVIGAVPETTLASCIDKFIQR